MRGAGVDGVMCCKMHCKCSKCVLCPCACAHRAVSSVGGRSGCKVTLTQHEVMSPSDLRGDRMKIIAFMFVSLT